MIANSLALESAVGVHVYCIIEKFAKVKNQTKYKKSLEFSNKLCNMSKRHIRRLIKKQRDLDFQNASGCSVREGSTADLGETALPATAGAQ